MRKRIVGPFVVRAAGEVGEASRLNAELGAGDGEALCTRLYNAGLDLDLLAAVRFVARAAPRVAVAGFSLGAGLALLALGRRLGQLPEALRAVAGVSPPLDLSACADALARPDNRLYQHYFMRMLRESYRRRVRARRRGTCSWSKKRIARSRGQNQRSGSASTGHGKTPRR